ncbi:MAG: XRE family transcriptional regulator [Salinarimonadaceae bacterium]|nr:MAG: XRE family transcriptional regulator [Salinarimonadaceae bacterium]
MLVKKTPNPIDVHVGSRVRMRRMMVGMSQEKLGEALGLTFQQIQKYEKGANRIGASRLHQIATALGVQIEFFYEGAPSAAGATQEGFAEDPNPPYMTDFLSTADGLQLMRAFVRVRDARVRKRVVDLVEALAEADDALGETK